jgi:hemerythrin superfamily protein
MEGVMMEDSQMMEEQLREDDVVALLRRHHEMVREMFKELDKASGPRKAEAFQRLARMLAMHEAAEEEVVHPYVRDNIKGGEKIVQARVREEDEAKVLLTDMMEQGPDDRSFSSNLKKLRTAVLEHADAEEREEFPKLIQESSEADRRAMADAVKAAVQAIAPSDARLGTPNAVMERTRDVIRQKMGKNR